MINVEDYLGLAVNVAKKLYKHPIFYVNMEIEDLVQVAYMSLIECHKRFDESKNVKFSTYSIQQIKFGCYNYVRDNYPAPGKNKNKLETWVNKTESLDEEIVKGEEKTQIINAIQYLEDFSTVYNLDILNQLSRKDQEIVTLRYEGYSLRDIAAMYKVTQGYISKIISAIKAKKKIEYA